MPTPVPAELSTYEIERNKPMPNRIHGLIQGRIIFLLYLAAENQYQYTSETSLATTPKSTPDVCIFEPKELNTREIKAKEEEPPITTIEIQPPSQSLETLIAKIWELYFPMGVQSAWIVIPALKAVQVILPDNSKTVFLEKDTLKDATTGIEIEVAKIFKDII